MNVPCQADVDNICASALEEEDTQAMVKKQSEDQDFLDAAVMEVN